ncbi:hypothetical protein D3C83_126280 [compost metagenome]
MIVDAEPAAAGDEILAGDHVGPVEPMTARRGPGAVGHLVTIGGEQQRPGVARAAQHDEGAHQTFDTTPDMQPL